MEATLTAIEMTGTIDVDRHLHLDAALPISGPRRVRVIVLYPPEELSESEWLQAAAQNPAFQFLHDPAEDIYSLTDGKPFHNLQKDTKDTNQRFTFTAGIVL